jgi:hypothetical protein
MVRRLSELRERKRTAWPEPQVAFSASLVRLGEAAENGEDFSLAFKVIRSAISLDLAETTGNGEIGR